MARSTAGIGDNSEPLTEDEIEALEAWFIQKILVAQKEAAEAKAVHDSKKQAVNTLFASVKAELKTSRKDFEDLIEKTTMSEAEFTAFWTKLRARYERNGLPVGAQLDMFPTGDTASDQAAARADGKRAGLIAADPVPPKYIAPILHPEWMAGWHDGQTELAMKLQKADGIFARRGQPDTSDENDVDLNADSEADEEADLDAKAEALANSDFMDTSDAGDDFEASDEELAGQTTRQAVIGGREGDAGAQAEVQQAAE